MTRAQLQGSSSLLLESKPIKLFNRVRAQTSRPSRPRKQFLDSTDTDTQFDVNHTEVEGWRQGHKCWEYKGPLAESWKLLKPRIITELAQISKESKRGNKGVAVNSYMVGTEPARARPVIFISNGDKHLRKDAKDLLLRSDILDKTDFEIALLKDPPTGPIRPVAMEDQIVRQPLQHYKQRTVYFDPRDGLRLTGMPIFIANGPGLLRKATANIAYNGTTYSFITAAHAVEELDEEIPFERGGRERAEADEDDEDEVLGLPPDFDSEYDEDEEDFRIRSEDQLVEVLSTAEWLFCC